MIKQWLLLIILFISFCFEVYAKDNCKFIGQINDDLWIIDNDGKPVQPLAIIERMKAAVTWSPDGKYIAYSTSNPVGEEQSIIVLDNAGRQVAKIVVEPKREHWEIRYIDRIVWRTPDILWSDSSVGKNGGFIDIWKLDTTWNHPAKHEKRIMILGGDCELSSDNKYVACLALFDDEGRLEISNTDKKEYPEARYYFDRNPRKIELKNMIKRSVRNIRFAFTTDNDKIILTNDGGKYKYDMKENKLSEIEELPSDVTIKTVPSEIELKSDDKHKAKVFDMHCDK